MRRRTLILTAALALLAGPALAGKAGPIRIEGAVVRASLGGLPNSAAYMTIVNAGSRPDRLVSVRCACAAEAQVHVSRNVNGVVSMEPAGPVAVPPHGRVSFAPDGLHVMLMGLKRPLVAGARQPMTLRFEHAGPMTVVFDVRTRIPEGGMGGMGGAMGGMAH